MGAFDHGEDAKQLVSVAAIQTLAARTVSDAQVSADADGWKSRVYPGERLAARTTDQQTVDAQRRSRVERAPRQRAQLPQAGPVVAELDHVHLGGTESVQPLCGDALVAGLGQPPEQGLQADIRGVVAVKDVVAENLVLRAESLIDAAP